MTNPRPFAVFDIDGTLIRWQMLHAIYDNLGRRGVLPKGDYAELITARKNWKARKSDEEYRAYEAKLVEIVERSMFTITVADFQLAVDAAVAEYKDQVYRYTRDLIKDLKQKGYMILAISGSPQEVVVQLAEHYGFDDFVGTHHVQKNGKFTGEIIVAPLHKPEILQQLIDKHGLSFENSVGVGDSEGDIGMLGMVQQPIAFNPSQKLFREAETRGWKIVVERKNMIYELEKSEVGYLLTHTNAHSNQ